MATQPMQPKFPIGIFSPGHKPDNYIGTIKDEGKFKEFIDEVKKITVPDDEAKDANNRLVWGIKYIFKQVLNNTNSSLLSSYDEPNNTSDREYILRSPLTYFQAYSDLFNKAINTTNGKSYHELVLDNSFFFKELSKKRDQFIFNNIKNYKNSLNIGKEISRERNKIAVLLDGDLNRRKDKLNEKIKTLEIDSSTLTRQAKINRDEFLRQEFKKHILRFTLLCICLIIFVSYSSDLGVGESTRLLLFSLLFFLYFVKLIMYYYEHMKRHNSDFNYKSYTTYLGTSYPTVKSECSDPLSPSSSSAKWFEFNFLDFNKNKKCNKVE